MKNQSIANALLKVCPIIVALTVFFTVGCAPGKSSNGGPEGSSSGGGGFATEPGERILETAKKQLSQEIRNLPNESLEKILPKDWSVADLAKIIEGVKSKPVDKTPQRDGSNLIFNYVLNTDVKKSHIYATQVYFNSHAAVAINQIPYETFSEYVNETKLKLIHEAAHILGIGTTKEADFRARLFALSIIDAIKQNLLVCWADKMPQNYLKRNILFESSDVNFQLDENGNKSVAPYESKATTYWVINPSTGQGVMGQESADLPYMRRFDYIKGDISNFHLNMDSIENMQSGLHRIYDNFPFHSFDNAAEIVGNEPNGLDYGLQVQDWGSAKLMPGGSLWLSNEGRFEMFGAINDNNEFNRSYVYAKESIEIKGYPGENVSAQLSFSYSQPVEQSNNEEEFYEKNSQIFKFGKPFNVAELTQVKGSADLNCKYQGPRAVLTFTEIKNIKRSDLSDREKLLVGIGI